MSRCFRSRWRRRRERRQKGRDPRRSRKPGEGQRDEPTAVRSGGASARRSSGPRSSGVLRPHRARRRGASIDRGFLRQRRFEGQPGQAQALLADDGTTIVALGVGSRSQLDADALRRAGAVLARQVGDAITVATTLVLAAEEPDQMAAAVEGIGLAAYRFEGARKAPRSNGLERVLMVVPARSRQRGTAEAAVRRGQIAVEATWRARDWVNFPARDLTPTELARVATEAAASSGVSIEVWEEDRIRGERLGGLLGVAAGAAEPPDSCDWATSRRQPDRQWR